MKETSSIVRLAILVVLATIATGWTAPIVNLQDGLDGYAGTQDTYILGDNRGAAPSTTQGNSTTLHVFEREITLVNDARTLITFDVSSLPVAKTASLTLTLQAFAYGTLNVPTSLYLVSTANGTWTEAQATWNNLNQGTTTPWAGGAGLATPGTDYNATAIATLNTPASSYAAGTTMTWVFNQAGVDAINDWIANPSQNAGFFLRQGTGTPGPDIGSITQFYSSEDATVGYRPLLSVTIPEPASVALLGLSLAGLLWRRRGN